MSKYYHIGDIELLMSALLMGVVFALDRVEKIGIGRDLLVGAIRCFVQLMVVGYVLQAIFNAHRWYWVITALVVMVLIAGVEAVRREKKKSPNTYYITIFAITLATSLVIAYGVKFIVKIKPWYNPQYIIPMMGMLMGNAMTGASLLFNRLRSEISANKDIIEAKLSLGATSKEAVRTFLRDSIKAAMIPTINYLMVIGLVSLPGMMTGQIIAGASPLDSVRYQVAIMYMISTSNAITIFVSAFLSYRQFFTDAHQLKEDML